MQKFLTQIVLLSFKCSIDFRKTFTWLLQTLPTRGLSPVSALECLAGSLFSPASASFLQLLSQRIIIYTLTVLGFELHGTGTGQASDEGRDARHGEDA